MTPESEMNAYAAPPIEAKSGIAAIAANKKRLSVNFMGEASVN